MSDPTPQQVANEMVEYGEHIAELMLADMDEEEAVLMVRDFCSVIAKWQPNVAIHLDDPIMLGVSCLATAALFQQCFKRAYAYTEKKVDAIKALKNALGDS